MSAMQNSTYGHLSSECQQSSHQDHQEEARCSKRHLESDDDNEKADNSVTTDGHVTKKPMTSSTQDNAQSRCDQEYFKAYSELDIHRDMLGDHVRTFGYRRAILSNYDKFYRKVVLDLGCGTGILSVFCIHAGARKVYAVDASDIAEQARAVVKSNGMDDKITVIQGKIEEVELPEKVDIIVSEWMGYMLLYEAMLPSLIFARDRWLNQGGYMFPHRGFIYIAPFSDRETYREKVDFWSTFKDYYSVDLSAIVPFAKEKLMERVHINSIMPSCLMSGPHRVFEINLYTITSEQLQCLEGTFQLRCFGHNIIHGFALWFIVDFPGNILLSTAPHNEETHWQQTLLYINPLEVVQDTVISGSMTVTPNSENSRFLNLNLKYEAYGNVVEKKYIMNDYI